FRAAVVAGRAALAGAGERPLVEERRIAGEDEGPAFGIDAHQPVAEAPVLVDAAAILAEHQPAARVEGEIVGMMPMERPLAGEDRDELVACRIEGPEGTRPVARLALRIAAGGGIGHDEDAVAETQAFAPRQDQSAIGPGLREGAAHAPGFVARLQREHAGIGVRVRDVDPVDPVALARSWGAQ